MCLNLPLKRYAADNHSVKMYSPQLCLEEPNSGMAVFARGNRLIEKVSAFINKYDLISRGDTVICGVSGGADSVCLLYCLKELSGKTGFSLHAVHVHHGIRGAEADADEQFVRETADKLGIPYRAFFVDVPAYCAEHKRTEEEAGRILRREAFARYIRENGIFSAKTALAHHRDDLAETVIYQLARGSGLAGLAGIRPKAENGENTVIRPLLCVSRREIEAWLEKRQIPFRTDRTNLTDLYARNRVRHHVMPYLEKEIHGGAAAHIAENALLTGEALEFIEAEAERRGGSYITKEKGVCLSGRVFSEETPFMVSCILRHCLNMLAPHQQDLTRKHIGDLLMLGTKENGKRIDLPGGIGAERTYDGLRLYRKPPETEKTEVFDERLEENRLVNCAEWSFTCAGDSGAGLPIPEKTYTKWIDFAIITDELRVRTRRPGDYLTVRADGAKKKLSDYMTDVKMPHSLRDRMPLIADGQEIVWIPGYRLSERYKITEKTRKVLKIEAVRNTGGEPDLINDNIIEQAGEKDHE